MPACDVAKCPKLDLTLKTKLRKQCKDGDRPWARIQTLVLDVVGPIVHVLELLKHGNVPNDAISKAVSQSLRFLGNATANISAERRYQVSAYLNGDLKALIEKEGNFKNATPLLFGKDFLSTAEEHTESVKALDKLSNKQHNCTGSQFFQTG